MQYLDINLKCLDESGVSLRETIGSTNEYFGSSYTAYINAVISMLIQSYDGRTNAFPAVPDTWKDVEFYNLPAESGMRVSGKMKSGKVVWLDYQKDGKKVTNPGPVATITPNTTPTPVGVPPQATAVGYNTRTYGQNVTLGQNWRLSFPG